MTANDTQERLAWLRERGPILLLAASAVLLQFLTNSRYGYFRDEFYYIACGEHLAFGYVDHPPLIALLTKLTRVLFGDSVFALRLLPALTDGALVFLAGLLAREFGGGRFAQALAAFAVLMAPAFLGTCSILTMNCFEILIWTSAIWVLVRLVNTDNPKLWLPLGVLFGVGLQNKHSMLFLGFGLLIGLLLTPRRKYLRDRHLWIGTAIAVLIILPNLVWEVRNHWPTLEFMHNASAYKNAPVSPLEFILGQILQFSPQSLLVWGPGLFWLLRAKRAERYRFLGWLYLSIFALFVLLKAKSYYLAPAYPLLFAAGGVAVEACFEARRAFRFRTAIVVAIATNIIALPMALPVVGPATMARYVARLGVQIKDERSKVGKLPQFYADRFGWDSMVATVADVYRRLAPEERARCAIYADNYGEAGAVDFLGKRYGLPKAISGHNNYFLWGPRNTTGEVMIVIGGKQEDLAKTFGQVELTATVVNEYAMPFESDLPIYLCRQLRKPLRELWPSVKKYI